MSVIQRPSKQGGATTYQGKVAAGYTKILAAEMDADLDLIYSAWNTGVDTINIGDGQITGAKLAAGAVGTRELADNGVATADLADGAVTTPKLADGAVTDAKLGTISFSKLTGTVIQLVNRLQISAGANFGDLDFNTLGTLGYDSSRPSWLLRTDYDADIFTVFRAPPPGTAFQPIFSISGNSRVFANLLDGSVTRAQLQVNACNGTPVFQPCPASFSLSTPGVYTTVATLPSITTRGGLVHLHASPNLSVTAPVSGGVQFQRWLRDGGVIVQQSVLVGLGAGVYAPFPGMQYIDSPSAGAHVYAYQVMVANGCLIVASGVGDGGIQAVEIG